MTNLQDMDEATAEFAGLPYVTELRSAEALSQRVGSAVVPTRIRVKRGRSAIVSWRRKGEGSLGGLQSWGWSAVVTSADKLANIRRRAARAGEPVVVHECSEPRSAGATGSVLLSGSVLADSKLGKEIARATQSLSGADALEVIRYNPGRRVLLKHTGQTSGDPEFIRIGTHSQQHLVRTTAQWARWGLPTLPVESVGSRGTAVRSPWWGTGDLETHPDLAAAEEAGVIIAELHRHTPAEGVPGFSTSPIDQAAAAADVLSQLLPEVGGATEDLVRRLHHRVGNEGGTVVGAEAGLGARAIHGDLSPDQVLIGHSECRIIDLDRAGVGHVGMDLGRWVAACRRRTDVAAETLEAGFLDGYRSAGGAEVDVEAWAVWAMLVTALEPWRECRPDWQQATLRAIGDAQQALTASERRVS
ncbi:phosphotransferase [Brevibacterium sp. RIT 803]|uniref:phosphotransferase family protein n=1 Tax=Brevibacterium sp. RIT 803 TaxID=2810210 RepID=UPI001950EDD5|nr:phosphotransferase [Brevibacterium sp. RIT 803]MBM6589469.1 phosphotransferase [Brevibacterium sp. RIT 803]